MSVDSINIGRSARDIQESPAFQPFSGVKIIVGKDSQGDEVSYIAGDSTWRLLEIQNPWGTQAIANAILAKIQGYAYKPFTATAAIIDPAVELGDIIYAGDVYSVIQSIDTTFSPIMSATVAAVDDSDLDHEYPYDAKENREAIRSMNGLRTSFTVELGRIESVVADDYADLESKITQTADEITLSVAQTYETKSDATAMEGRLNSAITLTAESITTTVAATYETKTDAGTLETNLRSEIAQTAESITSTVARSETKYQIPDGVTIDVYGFGVPSAATAASHSGEYYLDQNSGYYYLSNGTNWVRQSNDPLPLITDELASAITQTDESIRSYVSRTYQTKTDAGTDYNTLETMIEQRADSISLSVTSSSNGKTYFQILDGSTVIDSKELYLYVDSAYISGTITADAVAAQSSIVSPYIYDTTRDTRLVMDNTNYGLIIQTKYGNSWQDSFSIYDNGQGEISFASFGKSFMWFQEASNNSKIGSFSNITWDFSNATKVIMPDGTVFQ